MSTETNLDFEYLDLNTVDPNNSIPAGFYTLQLLSAERKDHVFGENSKQPGVTGSKFIFKWAITGDNEFAGRKLTSTIWQSSFAPVQFRKIADATGVGQKDGEAFFSWLSRLSDSGADLKVMVNKTDRGNDIDYRTAVPNV
jgi:hypothetical protein